MLQILSMILADLGGRKDSSRATAATCILRYRSIKATRPPSDLLSWGFLKQFKLAQVRPSVWLRCNLSRLSHTEISHYGVAPAARLSHSALVAPQNCLFEGSLWRCPNFHRKFNIAVPTHRYVIIHIVHKKLFAENT
jgi:hypothetical protein